MLDGLVEIDAMQVGGHVRPKNPEVDRVDRRKSEHRSPGRRVVMAVRERAPVGRTVPKASSGRRARIAPGTWSGAMLPSRRRSTRMNMRPTMTWSALPPASSGSTTARPILTARASTRTGWRASSAGSGGRGTVFTTASRQSTYHTTRPSWLGGRTIAATPMGSRQSRS